MNKSINITNTIKIGNNQRFALLAGPCAIESEEMTLMVASELQAICNRLEIPFIFKSSFDKANRTSVSSPRGVGIEKGLQILQRVKTELNIPIVTDVHESWQCPIVAEVADILTLSAFIVSPPHITANRLNGSCGCVLNKCTVHNDLIGLVDVLRVQRRFFNFEMSHNRNF